MKLSEIIKYFEKEFPLQYAYDWDNPGLLAGDPSMEVQKIMVTLDVTKETLKQAISAGADCIFSHHPVIFSGQKKITPDNLTGELLLSAIQNKIALYAAHTNLDTAPDGINMRLARRFGMQKVSFLEHNPIDPKAGLGVIGTIDPCTLDELAERTKTLLKTPFVRVCRGKTKVIKTLAIGSGACQELLTTAKSLGADAMITGDVKYHCALEAIQEGISVLDAGHFPTEELSKEIFSDYLKKLPAEIIFSKQKDVFEVI